MYHYPNFELVYCRNLFSSYICYRVWSIRRLAWLPWQSDWNDNRFQKVRVMGIVVVCEQVFRNVLKCDVKIWAVNHIPLPLKSDQADSLKRSQIRTRVSNFFVRKKLSQYCLDMLAYTTWSRFLLKVMNLSTRFLTHLRSLSFESRSIKRVLIYFYMVK